MAEHFAATSSVDSGTPAPAGAQDTRAAQTADDSPLLQGLTAPQQQAVAHIDGALLVLAGPGSGKTTVVTRRVAYLVHQGIPAWSILALTFTNKAAGEMRERIEHLLPPELPGRRGLTVMTFHSFCARLLRRYAEQAGLAENYTIYDSSDQRDAIKQALQRADMSSSNWSPMSILGVISNAKNQLMDAAQFAADADDFYNRSVARIYAAYEQILKQNNALDFDDLLLITARLLKDNAQVRRELQDRYQYLLIDEYQDTNYAQFLIAHTLASAHSNICVVGDPDQSIYGWRGADISNILDFEKHYPNATLVPLGQNFRSTGHIVAAAAGLISHNRHRKDKLLHTEHEDGAQPQVIACRDEHHEASLVADSFQRLRHDENIPWREMAVLYRMNALSRVLEEMFRRAGIPYVIARGTAFYDRKEVKDALSYLRVVVNPSDEVSLRRIVNTPTRGIGKTTLQRLDVHAINNQCSLWEAMRHAASVQGLSARAVKSVRSFVKMVDAWRAQAGIDGPDANVLLRGELERSTALAGLVERVIRESGLEESYRNSRSEEDQQRVENLSELVSAAVDFAMPLDEDDAAAPERNQHDKNAAASFDSNADHTADTREPDTGELVTTLEVLAAFLESIALVSDADAINPEQGAVTLLTLHTAKGLEYDAVAIVGLEEGILPHSRSFESDTELEEERRLCFVGMTRARRHLLMTLAGVRTQRGMRERTMASKFLSELPRDCIKISDQSGWGDLEGRADNDDAFDRDGPTVEPVFDDPHIDPYGGEGGITIGSVVRHPTFGVGRIEGITRRPAGSSVRVSFTGGVTKTLILEYAKLELVR